MTDNPRSVFLMEDWSPGQFYILDNLPDERMAQYLRGLFLAAHQALNVYPHLLSAWGQEVAERLITEIPILLESGVNDE